MALIARWQIDARFGHKQKVIEMLQKWNSEIGSQLGVGAEKSRIVTGSIGAAEATIEQEWQVPDLAELERAWAKLGSLAAHAQWGRELEPYVVSGSSRWTIYRVI
ncbi:MAG TPA: hypothetical protein VM491_03370 [Burkholderiaceae bacterium]|jgi:hypothetical protein|nr:hypothetical protein [Burkholderiaceae bacterium]